MVFYSTTNQREPVRDWLKSLDKADRLVIGTDILEVQQNEVCMVYVKVGSSLFPVGRGTRLRVHLKPFWNGSPLPKRSGAVKVGRLRDLNSCSAIDRPHLEGS